MRLSSILQVRVPHYLYLSFSYVELRLKLGTICTLIFLCPCVPLVMLRNLHISQCLFPAATAGAWYMLSGPSRDSQLEHDCSFLLAQCNGYCPVAAQAEETLSLYKRVYVRYICFKYYNIGTVLVITICVQFVHSHSIKVLLEV